MRFFVIAGEASGDMHGSNLIRAIQKIVPNADFEGFGGDRMKDAGMKVLRPLDKLSFMGFVEVIRNLITVHKNFSICKKALTDSPPDALILIDYPGFNLALAKWARKRDIRVFYYISPQVWAWKEGRVKQMKKNIDRLMVILPFEKEFFRKRGMVVDFVGHPLIDELRIREMKPATRNPQTVIRKENIIALLPGSRKQEIRHILPEMLKVQEHFPSYRFLIGKAPERDVSFYREHFNLGRSEVFEDGTYQLLSLSKAAMVASGTATLETGLLKVPQVVCYKAGGMSVRIARSLIRVPYISLVNLILDRPAIRELIQDELNTGMLVGELSRLLEDDAAIETMLSDYGDLWRMLGGGGASGKAARLIVGDVSEA